MRIHKEDKAAGERGDAAQRRDSVAEERESATDERETAAEERETAAGERESAAQRRELDYARSLLESAPDAMVIVNDNGIIQLANAETGRLFGYRRGELIGRSVEMLLPPRDHDRHPHERAGFISALRSRAMGKALELSGRRQDGGEFAVEIRLSALEPRTAC